MANVDEVAENVYLIDDQLFSIPKLGSVYLLNEERKALIESGPATSAKAVLDGIREVGVRPEDIDYIVVTHVHLDHAGGAGVLIKYMPKAQYDLIKNLNNKIDALDSKMNEILAKK